MCCYKHSPTHDTLLDSFPILNPVLIVNCVQTTLLMGCGLRLQALCVRRHLWHARSSRDSKSLDDRFGPACALLLPVAKPLSAMRS